MEIAVLLTYVLFMQLETGHIDSRAKAEEKITCRRLRAVEAKSNQCLHLQAQDMKEMKMQSKDATGISQPLPPYPKPH